jgi:hypothetical protein
LACQFPVTASASTTTVISTTTATTRNHEEVSAEPNNWGFYECHYF